jgi:tetratricopeptide (TPR) repeat protein
MNLRPRIVLLVINCVAFWGFPAFALHSGLTDANGDTVFSQEFILDYESANKSVDISKSVEPFLKLLKKYKKPEEVAELELSIGLIYNQRTGLVDSAKAVIHLSNALNFRLPEKTYIQILMWQGGSLEQLKKYDEALKDYLRGLLACSYHDFSGGWPEIQPPKMPIRTDEGKSKEDIQRARDYRMYRKRIDFQRFLLMQRYYLIEATKRILSQLAIDDEQLLKIFEELSPDITRHTLLVDLIKQDNKRPWP